MADPASLAQHAGELAGDAGRSRATSTRLSQQLASATAAGGGAARPSSSS